MTSHTRRVLELGVGLGLALTLVLTALADWHQRTAARVRADTIRLHILANSDTWDDQLLKLQVRDAVLAAIPLLLLYNGQRGRCTPAMQKVFYWFYPVHLSVLAAVTNLIL